MVGILRNALKEWYGVVVGCGYSSDSSRTTVGSIVCLVVIVSCVLLLSNNVLLCSFLLLRISEYVTFLLICWPIGYSSKHVVLNCGIFYDMWPLAEGIINIYVATWSKVC